VRSDRRADRQHVFFFIEYKAGLLERNLLVAFLVLAEFQLVVDAETVSVVAFRIERAQSALNREVAIDRVVLTPRGIKVRGFRVRQSGPAAAGDLIACDTALVTLKLKPLLTGKLVFDAMRLESPRIELSRSTNKQ
jgi:hypothetical protein